MAEREVIFGVEPVFNERIDMVNIQPLAWAETIVRAEVRGKEIYERLCQEIRAFPANRAQRVLHDGADKSRWRVSEREIRITDAGALADATHIHARAPCRSRGHSPWKGGEKSQDVFGLSSQRIQQAMCLGS
jgi:hypothetical protein